MNWECAYCGRRQIASHRNFNSVDDVLAIGENEFGNFGARIEATACLNPECQRVTVSSSLHRNRVQEGWLQGSEFKRWRLLPESSAKSQPAFIPKPLVDDYTEACRIRDLSPKASATLARRCLQGMIRDFCGISKSRLIDEIKILREAIDQDRAPRGVTHESVDAIDAVRSVGNIGAHMEKDVNLIVDIEANEAQLLIELIEMLFDEWYVERHKRAEKLSKIKSLSEEKANAKTKAKAENKPA